MHNAGTLFLKLVVHLFSLLFIFPAILFSILVLCLTDNFKSGMVMLISALILHVIVKFSRYSQSLSQGDHGLERRETEIFSDRPYEKESPPPLVDIYREIDCWNGETEVLHRMIRNREQADNSEDRTERCAECKQNECGFRHED